MDRKNKLILIAGGTGSGKTTVAKIITKKVGKKNVLLLSMDHYYKDFSYLKIDQRKNLNFDHPNSIDWPLLREHLNELIKGKSIKMPQYSFITHTREGYIRVESRPVIILEGIFALYNSDINRKAILRIYVETDDDIRLIRRIQRDTIERKRSMVNTIKNWLRFIKPMHEEFIVPTSKRAHVIIPEDPDGKMRGIAIDLIMTKIKSLLRK